MDDDARKWNYNISLGRMPEWWRYFGEYAWLVNLVFKKAEQSEVTVIARPQLFLIRHTLELGYKMNIIELEKISELPSNLQLSGRRAHNLEDLHQDLDRHFRKIAEKYDLPVEVMSQYSDYSSKLASLKSLFHRFDQWSYAFRYPVGTDGESPSLSPQSFLNMAEVREMYITAEMFLKYTTDVIAEHLPADLNFETTDNGT